MHKREKVPEVYTVLVGHQNCRMPSCLRNQRIKHDKRKKTRDNLFLEYCSVPSAILDENEIMHFSSSPYFVVLPTRTSMRLSYFQMRDFIMFYSKSHLNCSWVPNLKHTFPKICIDGTVYSSTQVTTCISYS
jgi:hypothetical protein